MDVVGDLGDELPLKVGIVHILYSIGFHFAGG